MMPNVEISAWGHALSLNILVPALILPGILFTALGLYPFIEQWVTGDKRDHNVLDRPRNVPTRTALGMTAITFYGILLARRRQRHHRHPLLAVDQRDHLDVPGPAVRPAADRVRADPAALPGAAAPRQGQAAARLRDRHHRPAAVRGVHRGPRPGLGRGARGPAGARAVPTAGAGDPAGRERRRTQGVDRWTGPGPAVGGVLRRAGRSSRPRTSSSTAPTTRRSSTRATPAS